MTNDFVWRHWASIRDSLPTGAADAIDSVGQAVGHDAEVYQILDALHHRELGFMTAIVGLMAIKDVSLADAKWLVHTSSAYVDTRADREASWQAMYDEIMNDPAMDGDQLPAD